MAVGDDSSPVPTDIKDTLCQNPDIEFVVVFGSRSEDAARPDSDLDIAVKFTDDLSAKDRFRKRCHLAGQLQHAARPPIDLSDIEELPLEFAHAAVTGDFVCGDEASFQTFAEAIKAEFDDHRADIERRHRERIRRIADEGLHG